MVHRMIGLNQPTSVIVAAGVATTISILGSYLYQRLKRPKIPTEWRPVGKIKKMCIFPMKSGRRTELQLAECTKHGLMEAEKFDKSFRLRDRSFLVYQEGTLEYRTARHHNKMVLVEIKGHDMDSVTLNAPGMRSLNVKVPANCKSREVVVRFYKNEPVFTLDCGDEAAKWISNYILGEERGLRVCYNDGSHERTHIPEVFKDVEEFYQRGLGTDSAGLNSDLTAVMMMTQVSVDDVNRRMENTHVPVESYRPSLLVDDPNLEPFEEDDWEWIKVGNVVMKNVVECWRCVMTTIDMETGIRRADREPLKTMCTYRISKGPAKDPIMGIMLGVVRTGKIAVGDTVYVGKL